ncbi:MAG: hypothetical protein SFX19_10085 [Alphaproteobacteria bacterium]|nr:hypothetical protein [Alphaproteobacteria bacterium]
MMTLSVRTDLLSAIKKMDTLSSKQLPFTIAKALTQTAKDVQGEVQRNMPRRFTLRRDWIVKGIRIKPATKQNLEALVYSRDSSFMGRQEHGGEKIPMQAGGKYILVPLSNVRRSKSQIISKSDLPQNLKNAFVITASDGRKYLAVRRGRKAAGVQGRARGGRGQVVLLYELVKSARIKPRLGLVSDGMRVAKDKFISNLYAAAEEAMRTAR